MVVRRSWHPPGGGSEPHVGLVTRDPALVDVVADVVTRYGGFLSVADSASGACGILQTSTLVAKIIDRDALTNFPPAGGCKECPALLPIALQLGEVALIAAAGEPPGDVFRASVYKRHALKLLLDDLKRALVATGAPAVRGGAERVLGGTASIDAVRHHVKRIAPFHDISVLVLGETGSGKELVARAIHDVGGADRPFVAINCAAVPETLFESEVFGHEAGSYTGARAARIGLLETAANGTVFLDEVAEMPTPLQAKLLRVLETRTFRRIGSNRDIRLSARIVSATNGGYTGESPLRPDLFYRLAGFTISLPALRERVEDVPILAIAFLDAFTSRHGLPPLRFSDEAFAVLQQHGWPGNVRELKSFVEHVAIVARGPVVTATDVEINLASQPRQARPSSDRMMAAAPVAVASAVHAGNAARVQDVPPPPSSQLGLRSVERELIVRTFQECGGNLSLTARRLEIPRSTLRDKLRKIPPAMTSDSELRSPSSIRDMPRRARRT